MAFNQRQLFVHFARSALVVFSGLADEEEAVTFDLALHKPELRTISNQSTLFVIYATAWICKAMIQYCLFYVLGTRLVLKWIQSLDHKARDDQTDQQNAHVQLAFGNDLVSSIRYMARASASWSRLLRGLKLALVYQGAYTVCTLLAEEIDDGEDWLFIPRIAIGMLLSGLHMRWTHAVVFGRSEDSRLSLQPRKGLLRPTLAHACAKELSRGIPVVLEWYVSRNALFSGRERSFFARKDVLAAISVLLVRCLLLYPTYAALVCIESKYTARSPASAADYEERQILKAVSHTKHLNYMEVLQLCYKRVALQMVAVHLVAAVALLPIELIYFVVFHGMMTFEAI